MSLIWSSKGALVVSADAPPNCCSNLHSAWALNQKTVGGELGNVSDTEPQCKIIIIFNSESNKVSSYNKKKSLLIKQIN